VFRRRGAGVSAAVSEGSSTPAAARTLSLDDVYRAAERRGMLLRLTSVGPAFSVTATAFGAEDPVQVGTLDGFVAPPPFGGILHLDSVRVYNSRLRGAFRGRAQTPFGIALLLGAAAFVHANSFGCTRAELLAIDDSNEYAERLVTYYRRLGFTAVRSVGSNGWRDVPDLLVWGGVGTRMDADIPSMIDRWSRAISRGTDEV
jgi:hypothetical protein